MGVGEVDCRTKRTGADPAIRACIWVAFLLALYGLYVALGNAGHNAARWWITSDSLYPVHVFIDTVLEGNPLSGWKFSIAPCWFPDLFLTAVFMAMTGNPIAATLLAGFVQVPLLVIGLRLLSKATGWSPGVLPETGALAVGCIAAVRLASSPDANPGLLGQFFLPQTHLGSLLITIYALVLAVLILRSVETDSAVSPLQVAAYSVLCFLGGMSDLVFVVQTLVPLTAVFVLAVPARVVRWRGAAWLLVPGWAMSLLGYAINRHALNTTPLAAQSGRQIDLAFRVFMDGFLGHLRIPDPFHLIAIAWLALTVVLAWKMSRSVLRDRLIAIVFATLAFAAMSSIGAVIVGGSMTLTVFRDYGATLRYLHPAYLLPIFALPFVASAYLEQRIRSAGVLRALAGATAVCVLLPSLSAARREPDSRPFTQYRHPVGEYLDELARKEGLKVGVAGYWQARPITLLSRAGIRAYAVTPAMAPFLWVSNADWYRPLFSGPRPQADFVVLDDPAFALDANQAYAAFGPPARIVEYQGVRVLLYRCGTCSNTPEERAKTWQDEPLRQFGQRLTTPAGKLVLKPREQTVVPVKLTNPGSEAWASWGKWPVNLAYRIYRDGNPLGEGERTPLPFVLAGGGSADVQVRVTAPAEAGKYMVRISAVQEGVAWLMDSGGGSLELPLVVR